MTITIIILIALIAAVFFFMRKRANHINWNPIDCIRHDGTMGFRLGDSYEFCISRFKHLGIKIDQDDFTSDMYEIFEYRKRLGFGFVRFGKNHTYNNIHEVSFRFDDKKLSSILIEIDFSQHGLTYMHDFLVCHISLTLNKEPIIKTKDFTKWGYSNSSVTLLNNTFNNQRSLTVQVLSEP